MRVLLVPEPMLGLSAAEVGRVVGESWSAATNGRCRLRLVDTRPAVVRTQVVVVPDPWGRAVPASYAVTADEVAHVESLAAACADLRAAGDDPQRASSAGLGELVLAAAADGVRTVVIPLDGLACHDGGAGLVGALAGRPGRGVDDLDIDDLEAARAALAGIRLVGRYEDDSPLLGLNGASAVQGPGKGMTPEQSQAAENAMGAFVDRMRRGLPEAKDLLTGTVVRRDRQPGAGAGGGVGHGILLLGGALEEASAARARELGLARLVRDADLVVTTTDRFDWRVLRSSLAAALATAAAETATPVVLLAGEGEAGRREAMALGLAGLYEIVESHRQRGAVRADPAGALAARTQRVARTWCPAR